MTFWIFLAALGAAWVLQSYPFFKQTQSFTKLFVAMHHRGRIAMGRFKGSIVQGAIVLFGIDVDGVITEGHRLNEITVVARFHRLEDFIGQSITDIDLADAAHHSGQVRKAVGSTREDYQVIIVGGQASEPPSALAHTVRKVGETSRRWALIPATDRRLFLFIPVHAPGMPVRVPPGPDRSATPKNTRKELRCPTF